MLRDHWREFPRELNSIDEVPPHLRRDIGPDLDLKQDVIHTYLIPQPRGFWDWFHDAPPRNDIFLLKPNEIIIARERADDGVLIEQCALKDVISVEVGTVLLNSWLNLTVANSHSTHEYRVEYGTIFERQFRDSILWLRALTGKGTTTPPRHLWRMPGEECIRSLPIKFNNAARNYWLEGESALATCFVPPIFAPHRVFARLRHNYSRATAIVVSDCEVSVITEQAMSGSGRWGQSWHFCPLKRLSRMEVVPKEPYPELHISLCVDATAPTSRPSCDLFVPFEPAQRSEIDRLLAVIENCRAPASG